MGETTNRQSWIAGRVGKLFLKKNFPQKRKVSKDTKRKEQIFEIVYGTRNSIINMFIKEKFTSTLKPLAFNNVDANTWGPDSNPKNKYSQN